MSFDPNYRPPGQNANSQGGGTNVPSNNQMRYPVYNPMPPQQQMTPQQQQQHQRFQNQQMPPGGGPPPPPGMMQQQPQPSQVRVMRITEENYKQYFEKLPPGLKDKLNSFPQEQRIARLQQVCDQNIKRHMQEQQQLRMNAQNSGGGGFHPQQQQQPQQQRFSTMPPQGNSDAQGGFGFMPGGQEQKAQISFPGPGPQGQKRKGPSPGISAAASTSAAPFPGPGPTAQNPSTVPTGPSSQPPPPQSQSQGLHQSQSQPSFNIQASQPPPQNPPGAQQQQDLKFSGGNQQIKNEPGMQSSLPQQQQQQFGMPNSQQQLQFQPLSSSQSQPSLLNPNQQKLDFLNQPKPEMSQQQQQMQTDFGPPPHSQQQHPQQQQQSQIMQQNQQQGFNVPPSQSMNQSMGQQQPSSMNQNQPMGQQQQQPSSMNQNQAMGQQIPPQHSFQPPQQQQQPQQQLLPPRPPGQMPQQQQSQPQLGQSQQQQTFVQGPSPAVHAGVASVGRVPTPSNKSVMSGGNIPQEIVNSKEYQETFSRLKQCRELCYRILQRMRLEQDSAVAGMQKTIEIIEGKRNVSIELMEKLIKNINSIHSRYDVTNGLRKTVEIIKKNPTLDMSNLVTDPYEQYKHLRISAPKEIYREADDAKNDRQQQQYIKKRMKWFEENNFWDGTEPTPYPWKRSIRQYTSEKLEEINREFNERIAAPFDETVYPYIPKDPNTAATKKVTFNAEVDILIRVDAKLDDRGEENEYDELESDESEDDVIVVEGDEEFESVENDKEKAEYENLEYFQSINNGNYEQQPFYDPNGELQYNVPQQSYEEIEQKYVPNDSEVAAPPPAKRIKVEEVSPKSAEQQQQYINPPYDFHYGTYVVPPPEVVTVPGPIPNYEFNTGENLEGGGDPQTLEDMEVAQSYEAYLLRQQQASYYEYSAMNTQMVQDELYSNALIMPNANYYQIPVMEPPPHEKSSDDMPPPDCPYSCCAPYEIDTIMGKPAILPKAAASELRKFRHRVDYENQPLSEHSPFYAIIINPTKANSKIKYPALRINIPKNYPSEAIDFQIVQPSSIHGKAAKSFFEKLEKRMFERRLCGISLHTISEVVSAFRYCVEIVHKKRDILDFSHLNIFV